MLQQESLIIQPIYKSIFAPPSRPFLKRQNRAAAGLAQGFHTAARFNFCHPKNKRQLLGCCLERGEEQVDNWDGLQTWWSPVIAAEQEKRRRKLWHFTIRAWITKALVKNLLHSTTACLTCQCGLHTVLERMNKTSFFFALCHLQGWEKQFESKSTSRLLLNGGHCS